jgi:hypothetical protein
LLLSLSPPQHADLVFFPLVLRLVNDDARALRQLVASVLRTLLARVPPAKSAHLLGFAIVWMGAGQSPTMRQAGAQVLGVGFESVTAAAAQATSNAATSSSSSSSSSSSTASLALKSPSAAAAASASASAAANKMQRFVSQAAPLLRSILADEIAALDAAVEGNLENEDGDDDDDASAAASFLSTSASSSSSGASAAKRPSSSSARAPAGQWQLTYHALLALEKSWTALPALTEREARSAGLVPLLQQLTLHPHVWVRTACARVLALYYARLAPALLKATAAGAASTSSSSSSSSAAASLSFQLSDTLLGDEEAVFEAARSCCALLDSRHLDDRLGELAVQNLTFLALVIAHCGGGAGAAKTAAATVATPRAQQQQQKHGKGASSSSASSSFFAREPALDHRAAVRSAVQAQVAGTEGEGESAIAVRSLTRVDVEDEAATDDSDEYEDDDEEQAQEEDEEEDEDDEPSAKASKLKSAKKMRKSEPAAAAAETESVDEIDADHADDEEAAEDQADEQDEDEDDDDDDDDEDEELHSSSSSGRRPSADALLDAAEREAAQSLGADGTVAESRNRALNWIFHRLSFLSRKAQPRTVQCIFRWFAGMVTRLGAAGIAPFLLPIMFPLHRASTAAAATAATASSSASAAAAAANENSDAFRLKQYADEVLEAVRATIGAAAALALHARVREALARVRQQRRNARAAQSVTDPAAFAKRKLAQSTRKRAAKRRRMEAVKAERRGERPASSTATLTPVGASGGAAAASLRPQFNEDGDLVRPAARNPTTLKQAIRQKQKRRMEEQSGRFE